MRADKGDGTWVDITDRMTWGQRNRIRDAAGGDGDFYSGFITTLCRELVTAWQVPGDLPLDPSGWEALDGNTGDWIMVECLKVWKAAPDPKATPTTPSGSPPA